MELWEYLNHRIELLAINGKTFIGNVVGFDTRLDNEFGEDSIHLEVENIIFDIKESEIISIKVIS
ncbi:LSM domain protein [Staphylococcus simulans]|uniref:LSM domain protein n=1 Tax=Staphylococcus simulans TaxID=1286 RepID=UPI00399A345F